MGVSGVTIEDSFKTTRHKIEFLRDAVSLESVALTQRLGSRSVLGCVSGAAAVFSAVVSPEERIRT